MLDLFCDAVVKHLGTGPAWRVAKSALVPNARVGPTLQQEGVSIGHRRELQLETLDLAESR